MLVLFFVRVFVVRVAVLFVSVIKSGRQLSLKLHVCWRAEV